MVSTKNIPFAFVLDYLLPLEPTLKPMFGCYGIYIKEKIVLVLRDRENHREANGVWIATSSEYHESLKKDFPSMCSVYILSDGKAETNWQMIPSNADDFESSAIKCCEFILQNDVRIGRIPKPKKNAATKTQSRKETPREKISIFKIILRNASLLFKIN